MGGFRSHISGAEGIVYMKSKAAVMAVLLFVVCSASAWVALAVASDPLVRMPGTQPAQGVNLEAPNRCLNCHADYDHAVEPGFNWKGSMMAQAARDPKPNGFRD